MKITENTIHKKHRVIALAVLLVLQTLILVSWQSRKQGDFVDEFYTLADAHEFSVTGKKQMYFHEQEDWQPERWLTVGLFQDRLTVSPEFDAEDFSVPGFLKTFVTGRNYMGMLNLAERALSPGELSRTPAFFLNIVSFLGLQLLVYALLRRMRVRFIPAMLCLILLGGCTMMLSMAVYIRFYLWTGMLFAGTVLLHCLMWTETRPVRNLLMEAGAVFLLYLGLRNSELIIVLAGALVLSFTVGLLIRKRWAQAAYYAGPIITGGIGYLALKTGFLTALLDPGSTEAASGQTGALLQTLGNTDLPGFWEHIGLFFDTLGEMLFDSYGVMLVFFLTAAAFAVFARVSRRKQGGEPASGSSDAADAEGFRHVLAAVIVIDILFLSAAEYTEEDTFRYAFLIYPLIAAVLWTVLDRFAGREGGWQRGAAAVLAALTVVGSLMPFHDEDVRGLYENHAPVLEALEPYRETATILAFDEYPLSHTIYECIARMDASAPLYIMDPEHHTIDPSDCPDTMVLWISRKHRSAPYTRDLRADGYELEKLGQTNASVIWLCRR